MQKEDTRGQLAGRSMTVRFFTSKQILTSSTDIVTDIELLTDQCVREFHPASIKQFNILALKSDDPTATLKKDTQHSSDVRNI